MSDIATVVADDFTIDYVLQGPGLQEDDGLYTAVVISLFTDRRAVDGDLPASADGFDKRGWWGDTYADVAGDRIGSRLWLLRRAKQTLDTLNKARDFAAEALQWMVDDQVARAVNVSAEWMAGRSGVLVLTVEILRSNGTAARYRFEAFWKGQ